MSFEYNRFQSCSLTCVCVCVVLELRQIRLPLGKFKVCVRLKCVGFALSCVQMPCVVDFTVSECSEVLLFLVFTPLDSCIMCDYFAVLIFQV